MGKTKPIDRQGAEGLIEGLGMITKEQYDRVIKALPFLLKADPALLRDFQRTAYLTRISTGQDVFVEGDLVGGIALLISGFVRVYKIGETGREITLYRFGHGESCILSANAILSQKSFPAIATVEQEAEAVMIPADSLRDWVRRHDIWRDFIFDLLSQRLLSVMTIVEEVAFHRMDTRIAAYLLARGVRTNPVQVTHQEIAAELGSSREVISRILGELGRQGIIVLARGTIEILDFEGLNRRAAA
jgi:CRP/FNR family transcriptional regulator